MAQYTLTEEKKLEFSSVYVLEFMVNRPKAFPLFLEKNDEDLEPILEWLMARDLIQIHEKEKYIPTEKGRSQVERFLKRYSEYLNVFDVYCAVDLEAGEFGFASYFEIESDEAWKKFIADPRWEDLRIAVAEYKKMDPIEIVYMSFIQENRFGRDESGWQFDLLLGTIWDEILDICNNAIHWEQLGFEDVPAKNVIEDIICQGAELMIALHEEDEHRNPEIHDEEDEGDAEEYVERVHLDEPPIQHYHHYRDPFYVDAIFLGLLLF